jgi:hypothetical protein
MTTPNINAVGLVKLRRDSVARAWTMSVGGEWKTLPWADTADAVSVVMWVKSQMTQPGQVRIEL